MPFFLGKEVRTFDVKSLIVAMSIPSAITGFCFWMLQNHL